MNCDQLFALTVTHIHVSRHQSSEGFLGAVGFLSVVPPRFRLAMGTINHFGMLRAIRCFG